MKAKKTYATLAAKAKRLKPPKAPLCYVKPKRKPREQRITINVHYPKFNKSQLEIIMAKADEIRAEILAAIEAEGEEVASSIRDLIAQGGANPDQLQDILDRVKGIHTPAVKPDPVDSLRKS